MKEIINKFKNLSDDKMVDIIERIQSILFGILVVCITLIIVVNIILSIIK